MIREFRQLAGCTPKRYVELKLPFGGVSADEYSASAFSSGR